MTGAARTLAALVEARDKADDRGARRHARAVEAMCKNEPEPTSGLSGNPLVAPAMATHWTHTQRVMGEVLMRDETPRDIWDQHADILDAVTRGDPARAEALARSHINAGRKLYRIGCHAGLDG